MEMNRIVILCLSGITYVLHYISLEVNPYPADVNLEVLSALNQLMADSKASTKS